MSRISYLQKLIDELEPGDRRELATRLMAEVAGQNAADDRYAMTLMADYTEAAEARYQTFGHMQGISTGYPSLDDLTKGLVPGELVVVAGRTSRGKTTLAINISNRVALQHRSVLFVTLEMTHEEVTGRYMKINGGNTDVYQTAAALTAFQQTDDLDWKDVAGLIKRAKHELNVELVVIDHLHYFSRELERMSEDLGRVTKEFKLAAKKHNLPIMLISHVRKTSRGEEASMEDLRGSSYIAQDADIVLMVGRDDDRPQELLVLIEKNRNRGFNPEHDTVVLDFDGVALTEHVPNSLGGKR